MKEGMSTHHLAAYIASEVEKVRIFGKIYNNCRFSRLLRRKRLFWGLICRLLRQLFAAYCAKPDLCCRLLRQTCKTETLKYCSMTLLPYLMFKRPLNRSLGHCKSCLSL
jgi:hypothetical protein